METKISGSVLSSILYELSSTPVDLDGFLLGRVIERTEATVSDSTEEGYRKQRSLIIDEVVPCRAEICLSLTGDEDALDNVRRVLKPEEERAVVGWFRFRADTPLRPSIWETASHHHLTKLSKLVQDDEFIFALWTASTGNCGGVLSYDYSFLTCQNGQSKFRPVKVEVLNIVQNRGQAYHEGPAVGMLPSGIGTSFHNELAEQQVVVVENLYKEMLSELKDVSMAVLQSGEDVGVLLSEVEELRIELAAHEREVEERHEAEYQAQQMEVETAAAAVGNLLNAGSDFLDGMVDGGGEQIVPASASQAAQSVMNVLQMSQHRSSCGESARATLKESSTPDMIDLD